MPDLFSSSGIADLPPLSVDTLTRGDPRVLGWLTEAIQEGDRLNQEDPAYDLAERGMQYIAGEQSMSADEARLTYLPKVSLNQSRKATQAHVSALTDLKPTFAYKALNPTFTGHGDLLNRLVIAWWLAQMADLELGHTIKYALAGGTGDLVCEWNPYLGPEGDVQISARDFRDTLPVRPGQVRRLQDWQGVILREEHSVNVLRGLYPTKAHLFRPTTDSLLASIKGRFRTALARLVSPAADTLSGLTQPTHRTPRPGGSVLYRAYLNDQTRNLTGAPIPMGNPAANYAYVVQPGARLYPFKRLIVATPDATLYDGPSTYWHGMFPVCRLKLWDLPWQFLGQPLLADTMPIQDAINTSARELLLGIRKWMNKATLYNREAVGDSFMRTHDPRRPGAKVKLNASYGEGFKELDGPNPQVLATALELLTFLLQQHDALTGTANLQTLMQLRQLPGADTIQKYYEALTPELRQEGRMVEAFLRDLAEQFKSHVFQHYSTPRRVMMLGDVGAMLEDFDFDPGDLVPAMQPGQPGYAPQLDAARPAAERARYFMRQFVFTVAPNSILAMTAQEQKMMRFQLARMGYYDFWSLMESLEIPNVGQPPALPLPPLRPPAPEEIELAAMQASMGMPGSKYVPDPMTGQLLEVRVPTTITERLMAQQLLGIGMTANPAGRKASGQEPPQMEEKKDETGAPRQTVTESQK